MNHDDIDPQSQMLSAVSGALDYYLSRKFNKETSDTSPEWLVEDLAEHGYKVVPIDMKEYPYKDGDITVLGPQVFADRKKQIINFQGENFVLQQSPYLLFQAIEAWTRTTEYKDAVSEIMMLLSTCSPFLADLKPEPSTWTVGDAQEMLRRMAVDNPSTQNQQCYIATSHMPHLWEAQVQETRHVQCSGLGRDGTSSAEEALTQISGIVPCPQKESHDKHEWTHDFSGRKFTCSGVHNPILAAEDWTDRDHRRCVNDDSHQAHVWEGFLCVGHPGSLVDLKNELLDTVKHRESFVPEPENPPRRGLGVDLVIMDEVPAVFFQRPDDTEIEAEVVHTRIKFCTKQDVHEPHRWDFPSDEATQETFWCNGVMGNMVVSSPEITEEEITARTKVFTDSLNAHAARLGEEERAPGRSNCPRTDVHLGHMWKPREYAWFTCPGLVPGGGKFDDVEIPSEGELLNRLFPPSGEVTISFTNPVEVDQETADRLLSSPEAMTCQNLAAHEAHTWEYDNGTTVKPYYCCGF